MLYLIKNGIKIFRKLIVDFNLNKSDQINFLILNYELNYDFDINYLLRLRSYNQNLFLI